MLAELENKRLPCRESVFNPFPLLDLKCVVRVRTFLFGTKRRLSTGVKLNVICNGNVIESKSNVTYLGVTLDQFLSGEIIASNILYKSSNKLKFLYRNAGKFNLETKKLLISALIQCHFDYTCSAWYNGLSKKLKCRMQCTQNKIYVKCSMEVPCWSQ